MREKNNNNNNKMYVHTLALDSVDLLAPPISQKNPQQINIIIKHNFGPSLYKCK